MPVISHFSTTAAVSVVVVVVVVVVVAAVVVVVVVVVVNSNVETCLQRMFCHITIGMDNHL